MRKRAIAALAAVSMALPGCAFMGQQVHTNCEVTAKDILTEVSGSGGDVKTTRVKRVSTTCGPFNVEDAFEVMHFNSWDLWQKLEVGKIYDIKTGGPRAGFFSMFPVVLEVTDTGKR